MSRPLPNVKVVTGPALEPVTVADIKEHLRLNTASTAEDSLLARSIVRARELIEAECRIAMVTQTVDEWWQEWPDSDFQAGRSPLVSVTGLYYTDSDGTESTVSTSLYDVDTDSEPGRITLGYGDSWPVATLHPKNPIRARYVAGFGSTAVVAVAKTPERLKHYICVLVGEWYENRELTASNVAGAELKLSPGSRHLIDGFWVPRL